MFRCGGGVEKGPGVVIGCFSTCKALITSASLFRYFLSNSRIWVSETVGNMAAIFETDSSNKLALLNLSGLFMISCKPKTVFKKCERWGILKSTCEGTELGKKASMGGKE